MFKQKKSEKKRKEKELEQINLFTNNKNFNTYSL